MSLLPGMFPAGAAAAKLYPRIEASAVTEIATVAGSHAYNLPSSIVAGELLLIAINGSGTNQTPSGWTKLLENGGTVGELVIYTKTASGSEGSTVTASFQSGNTSVGVSVALRISGWVAVEGTVANSVTSAQPDPPSHTASFGAGKALWLSICAATRSGTTDLTPITPPSGYANTLEAEVAQTVPDARIMVGIATLNSEAATQDPAAFALAATPDLAAAATVVVRP